MSRVRNEYSSRETGSSPSAFQMEKREQSNSWFKWFAIIISILCVIFMIATAILVLKLSLKFNEEDQIKNRNNSSSLSLSRPNEANELTGNITSELKNEAIY
uniref:Uncharacterized protein n=2 Tax=Meloidogyne TaxID=189290 RepID=A0A6V7UIN9_MELEN|nr:unnamed protein product [Meloidogyne enterolobii]